MLTPSSPFVLCLVGRTVIRLRLCAQRQPHSTTASSCPFTQRVSIQRFYSANTGAITSTAAAAMSSVEPLIEADELHQMIQKGLVNQAVAEHGTVRIVDCTFKAKPSKPDPEEYKRDFYGQWERLITAETDYKLEYKAAKIPGAIHFDIHAAKYPSDTEHYALYPPEMFQEYVRLLGINKDDHLICYDRGPAGGMMFATRAFWTFKVYGHDKISVLNGGYQSWTKNNLPVTDEIPTLPKGNWAAHFRDNLRVTYDYLTGGNGYGIDLLNGQIQEVTLLDTRPDGQYTGKDATGLLPHVDGTYIPNTTNLPSKDMIGGDGRLKAKEELEKLAESYEVLKKDQHIISYCNTGMNASLAAFGLYVAFSGKKNIKLYFGGLKEIERKDPSRISGKVEKM